MSIGWSDVYEAWKAHYDRFDETVRKAFNHFYNPQLFFGPKSATVGMPLSVASALTGRYEVVMSLNICEQLLKFITQSIPQVPPPSLSDLTPVLYEISERFNATEPNVFLKYQQKVKRKNKQREKLRMAKRELELAKRLLNGDQYVFISLDIEAYESDHSILLEIGWSMYDAKNKKLMDQHYVNSNYRHLKNGKFVADQKEKFLFGTSVWCTMKQALIELRKDLDWAVQRDGGFILVGHGLDSDLKYLHKEGFHWPTADGSGETLNIEESAKIAILNTDTIYAASINNLHNPPSLGKTLDLLHIETWNLHNAGNDAHYTLLLLMMLVGDKSNFS
ncbi:uncharacterized protein BX663DRAFT_425507 [Cokeromyces recurvatus]|uniref:uncharacterized protein n=1 Tax=Cokeromyces recurvatus TaxID=90255 RepID=UPI00221EE4C1|nr:uncharacterized protein BX663DRAFT_425507 [Cokeromyces recurvatus]KAI7908325.1 hypothetical protein BX663DRAFT_425507 [Cokeromyces recurvatus]